MRIYDIPKGFVGLEAQLRICIHGSCRVYDPFEALAADGKLIKACANDAFVSYTLGEAQQTFRYCLGEEEFPPDLAPFFIDEPTRLGPWQPVYRRTLNDVDAFIVEVSELRELSYRGICFQIQVFLRNFVAKYGAALVPWFGALSTGKHISEELVQEALARLPDISADEHERVRSILSEARLETVDVAAIANGIDRIRFNPAARWLFVSHFTVPGMPGALMDDRRSLAEILRQATEPRGVAFFDPTELVARHGREQVLANTGRDIYHYDPRFHEQVAEVLLERVQVGGSAVVLPLDSRFGAASPVGRQAVEALSSELNASLISYHRERLGQLGVDGSGLHSHYAGLLERGEILGKQETDLVDLILNYLPEFEEYHVLCAGLGEVAFLLAGLGVPTTACDPFTSRFSAIIAGADRLGATGMYARGRFRAAETAVPSIPRRNSALCVATQLAITASPAEETKILERLEKYRALLFRPSLLVRSRESTAEQEQLLGRFRDAGFSVMREYPLRNLVCCAKEGEVAGAPSASRPGGRLRALARALVGRS